MNSPHPCLCGAPDCPLCGQLQGFDMRPCKNCHYPEGSCWCNSYSPEEYREPTPSEIDDYEERKNRFPF